jgi:hypothetical protein
MNSVKYILFAIGWAAIIYLLNCVIARQFKRIEPKQLLMCFTTTAMVGLFGEIFLNTAYNFFVGHPLWYYNILPIQGGYTSSYAIVTWGLYGMHLYLLHGSLAAKWSITRTRHLALILSVEALVLEALLTLSARLVIGKYMYYYLPGDLWHVSSLQNIPFYFAFGAITVKLLKRFRADPVAFSLLSIFVTTVLAFMAH